MSKLTSSTFSESVRQHAQDAYLEPARRRGEKTVTVNAGKVQKAVGLRNRVALVCQALESDKFLEANGLRLISKTGPPSGLSTTVNYTYEFVETPSAPAQKEDPWTRLRGALKDVFAELGGGEAYLRDERNSFHPQREAK